MRRHIKVIKFTAIFSLLSLILTYLTTLNIESSFLILNTPWISNNFLLTVFSGIFCGFIVAFINEIGSYNNTKHEIEGALFYSSQNLYIQLFSLRKNIRYLLDTPEQQISENFCDFNVQNSYVYINSLQNCDYVCLNKENRLSLLQTEFNRTILSKITPSLNHCIYLRISICTTQLTNLKMYSSDCIVTSAYPLVKKTLQILEDNLSQSIECVSSHLNEINLCCKNRFNWNENKSRIEENCLNLNQVDSFETFLQTNVEQPYHSVSA